MCVIVPNPLSAYESFETLKSILKIILEFTSIIDRLNILQFNVTNSPQDLQPIKFVFWSQLKFFILIYNHRFSKFENFD